MMPLLFIWRKFPTDRWKHVNPAHSESRNSGLAEENGSAQTNRVFSSLRKRISAVPVPAKMTKEGQGSGLPQGCMAQSPCQLAVKSFSYTRTGPRPLWWQKSVKSHGSKVSVLLLRPSRFLTVLVGLAPLQGCPVNFQPTIKLPTSSRQQRSVSPRCHCLSEKFPLQWVYPHILVFYPDSSIPSNLQVHKVDANVSSSFFSLTSSFHRRGCTVLFTATFIEWFLQPVVVGCVHGLFF